MSIVEQSRIELQEVRKQGRMAYQNGKPNTDNPHPIGTAESGGFNTRRYVWFDGWFNAKYEPLLKKDFANG